MKQLLTSPMHRILFYVFLFLIPIQTRILYSPGSSYIGWYFDYHVAFFLYLSDILLFVCFTAWLLFDPPKMADLSKNRLFSLILAFFTVVLLTLFHVKHLGFGLYSTIKWLEVLILLIYIKITFFNKVQFHILAQIVFASAVLQAILGWWQFHVQHKVGLAWLGEYIAPIGTPGLAMINLDSEKVIRAYGTLPHPNILGAFLVLGLICSLYLVSQKPRIIYGVGLIFILLGLFTTFSRLAWLGGGLAIICFLIFWKINRPAGEEAQQWKHSFIIILLAVIVSCGTIFGSYHKYFKARTGDASQASINDRYFFNNLGLDLIKRYPVLGVGAGNYVEAQKDLYKLEPWQYQPAHNIFIFIAAEFGILGLLLFLMILKEIFKSYKNTDKSVLTFSFRLVGIIFLLMSQFDHYFATIQQGRLMFFTVLGLIAALPNLKNTEVKNFTK